VVDPQAIRSSDRRDALLPFARNCACRALGGTPAPDDRPRIEGRFGGAFVTFVRGKTLRGCVGRFEPTTEIVDTVEEVTRASLADSRFANHPITLDELGELTIEVSLLTDPFPTDDPLSLVPGTHGVIVRAGGRSGCFLPKVASERGWTAEEFLSNCCATKAGLADDAWRSPETEVLLFTADVLSEEERD